jgi:beta-lactamase class A
MILVVGDEILREAFESAGCRGALHIRGLSDGSEVALGEDEVWLAASVIKVPIGLEFFSQVEEGELDPRTAVTLAPERRTPGPTGIALGVDPVTMSLRDLCTAMLTVSDNAATDVVLETVGKDAVNRRLQALGCTSTVLVESIAEFLDSFSKELGFENYSVLLRAQAGELGRPALVASTDQERIGASRVLDPARANRITARDMTRLLSAVWAGSAGPPRACANLRGVMARQVTRRLGPLVPEGGSLAAKSGGLFGRVRNEIGVISDPGGESHAVAVLTRLHRPFGEAPAVDDAMRSVVRTGIAMLEAKRSASSPS